MNKTVDELVCEVAKFAKKHRWTKGSRKRMVDAGRGAESPRFEYCLLGFCDEVFWTEHISLYVAENQRTYRKVVERIAAALPSPSPVLSDVALAAHAIVTFNDAPQRTKKDVIAVLDKACVAK